MSTIEQTPVRVGGPLTREERVRNGMTFLDEHVHGWRDRIDPSTLDINKTCSCVLGQLYGMYEEGVRALGIGSRWGSVLDSSFSEQTDRLGFSGDDRDGEEWHLLTKAWKEALT